MTADARKLAEIDRSSAVNLARTIRETDNIENVTRRGILSLVDAVLRMDEALRKIHELPSHVPLHAWTSVKDRLPDDDTTVMIAGKMDEPVWLGFHDESGWYSVDATPLRDSVTHWMALPEGPK